MKFVEVSQTTVKKLLEDLGLREFENLAASEFELSKELTERLANVEWGSVMSGDNMIARLRQRIG